MTVVNITLIMLRFLRKISTKRYYYTVKTPAKSSADPTPTISGAIRAKIKATGPITVADYMKETLISPHGGYYMSRDVFGEKGDFITSPELGQIFGEMVAVWFLNEWSKIGAPKPFQIVELGPGRGSLSQDILRVFEHFNVLKGSCLHMVEASMVLSDLQAKRLCIQSGLVTDKESVVYREGITHQGIPAKWFRDYRDVPDGFSLVVANEFFDALPVHKLQKTEQGYREVLIDLEPGDDTKFRYVIAKNETPATKLYLKPNESREHVEVSPESLVFGGSIARKLAENGGLCLIADYGHNGDGTDTFRAFKKHKLHDPLIEPGTADLTADVDFAAIKDAMQQEGGVVTFGPIAQRQFLLNMGVEHRVEALKEHANEKQKESVDYSFRMMTDEDKMGSRFKFLAVAPEVLTDFLAKYPPAAFK